MPRKLHNPGESAAAPETEAETTAEPEVEAEPAAKAKAGKAAKALTRDDYAKMHSSEVDPSTLSRSVLCKDGWVAPLPKDKDGKPQTHLLRTPGEA